MLEQRIVFQLFLSVYYMFFQIIFYLFPYLCIFLFNTGAFIPIYINKDIHNIT